MVCYVVGAGETGDLRIPYKSGDMLIAADGGFAALQRAGLVPDAVIGDFDSSPVLPDHPRVTRLPVCKDDTDMAAAVRMGEEAGYTRFCLYGGTGGRIDHTLANVQLLSGMAARGLRGELVGGGWRLTALRNGTLRFPADARGILSVFSLSDTARGVTLAGVQYPLQDACLSSTVPLGVSNAFCGAAAEVTVREGVLLVAWEDAEANFSLLS